MNDFIKILIVEDNEVTREMMARVLWTRGYTIFQASGGEEALNIIDENDIHVLLVDINMTPMDGLEFIKNLVVHKIKIPIVVITADLSTDLLSQAIGLGVQKVLQKPLSPDRLLKTVGRIIERQGLSADTLFVEKHSSSHSHKDLMKRCISLAENNEKTGKGRPFGAIVADKGGHILGSGTNGIASRADPTAHAEVMAIRQAAEKLESPDLSDCILYCSSAPTMIGEALIISVGIKEVYYGLSHKEVHAIRSEDNKVREALGKESKVKYKQLCHDEAMRMLENKKAS